MRNEYLSKAIVQIVIVLFFPVASMAQPKVFPGNDMTAIYGHAKSLIACARGWNPVRIYLIDPEYYKYINKGDVELLQSRRIVYFFQTECRLQNFIVSDTTIKIKLNAKDLQRNRNARL